MIGRQVCCLACRENPNSAMPKGGEASFWSLNLKDLQMPVNGRRSYQAVPLDDPDVHRDSDAENLNGKNLVIGRRGFHIAAPRISMRS